MKKIIPYLLIVLGFLFVLQNFGILERAVAKLWPVLVIIYGIGLMVEGWN